MSIPASSGGQPTPHVGGEPDNVQKFVNMTRRTDLPAALQPSTSTGQLRPSPVAWADTQDPVTALHRAQGLKSMAVERKEKRADLEKQVNEIAAFQAAIALHSLSNLDILKPK